MKEMKTTDRTATAKTAALALMALVAVSALACALPGADADVGETTSVDLGQKYSMKVQFIFSGSDASGITWDFGDGTTSNEWNPLHKYAATGVYHGSQVVTNSYNGGSSTTLNFTIEIMGYPEIHFEENGGSEVADIEQTAFDVVAEKPADPVREGYTFAGWYTDADLTEAMDWSSGIKKDITLYAAWTSDGTGPVPAPEPDSDDDSGFAGKDVAAIAVAAFGVLALIAGLYTRHPAVLVLSLILLAIAGLMRFEVI